ncbi:hypothetical protein DINM_005709 [Dirofilaria immitis]|nr:hypothetical protein [Dirofilaria immitis]
MEDPDTVVAIRNRAFASVIPRQIRSFKLSLVGGNYMRTSMLLYYFAITILSSCIAQTPVLNENNQSVQAKVIDRLKQENVTEQFNLDQTVWHQNSSSDQEKRNITRIGCEICDKKYGYLHNLIGHRVKHAGKKFVCNVCGKQYVYNSGLQFHIKTIHKNQEILKYDMCGENYRNALLDHGNIRATKNSDAICATRNTDISEICELT